MMKKILFCIFTLIVASSAMAAQGDLNLQVRTIAQHFDGEKHNDNVWGVGIEYEPIDRVKVGFIHGRNSFVETRYSNYLLTSYSFYRSGVWDLAGGIWVADNYQTRIQSDTKTTAFLQLCNQTTEVIQICGNYNVASTGVYVPSGGIVVKWSFNK
jgi:hypothetical protein